MQILIEIFFKITPALPLKISPNKLNDNKIAESK